MHFLSYVKCILHCFFLLMPTSVLIFTPKSLTVHGSRQECKVLHPASTSWFWTSKCATFQKEMWSLNVLFKPCETFSTLLFLLMPTFADICTLNLHGGKHECRVP